MNTATATVNTAGNYTLIVKDPLNGCINTANIFISQESYINADFIANPLKGNTPIDVSFTNLSSGALTYNWIFGNGIVSNDINPTTTYTIRGSYFVKLYAINGECIDSITKVIIVEDPFIIPEIFTPNDDGRNETYQIIGIENYPNNVFEVYNRWGNLVYTEIGYKNTWNGSSNTSSNTNKLPAGTYYYILFLNDQNKSKYNGFIQLQY